MTPYFSEQLQLVLEWGLGGIGLGGGLFHIGNSFILSGDGNFILELGEFIAGVKHTIGEIVTQHRLVQT